MIEFLIAVLFVIGCYAFSWGVCAGVMWLICLCFSWNFNLLIATGIWLIMCLLKAAFGVDEKGGGSDA